MTAPVEFQQLAQQALRVVQSNNAMKIFYYNEMVRQNLDYTSKGLPVPAGYEAVIPTLTYLDTDKYIALYVADNEANKDPNVDPAHLYDNLAEAYSFYRYVPPVVAAPKVIPQPRNPLGPMIDEELGLFGRAPGDRHPVGKEFNFLGTIFILKDFGRGPGGMGNRLIFWERQAEVV